MIASLMVFALVAGVLAAAVGRVLEEATRIAELPGRWAWAGALALTIVLVALAPFRSSAVEFTGAVLPAAELVEAPPEAGTSSSAAPAPVQLVRESLAAVLGVAVPVDTAIGGAVLGAAWLVLTMAVLGAGLGLLAWSRRVRGGWPSARLMGERVRIAPDGGPAVAGLLPPEIVVPRWLLAAPASERRMAIVHELEHLRAGDPYTLAFGYLVVALLPWNPAVWWMHRRLRLAVELDCDRRLLRRGVARRSYGSFLIDAAALARPALPGMVTLAASKPVLERRIEAMTRKPPRYRILRASLLAPLGGFALIAACEAKLPTDAEIEAMDVAGAEARMVELRHLHAADVVAYFVDGEEVSLKEAKEIPADEIARIDVMGTADGDRVQVWTKAGNAERLEGAEALLEEAHRIGYEPKTETVAAEGSLPVRVRITPVEGSAVGGPEAFTGLFVIDGQVADISELGELDPARIETISVLKGEAASRLYDEPAAAHGVILVTTKH